MARGYILETNGTQYEKRIKTTPRSRGAIPRCCRKPSSHNQVEPVQAGSGVWVQLRNTSYSISRRTRHHHHHHCHRHHTATAPGEEEQHKTRDIKRPLTSASDALMTSMSCFSSSRWRLSRSANAFTLALAWASRRASRSASVPYFFS